jgi:hypothetical protein
MVMITNFGIPAFGSVDRWVDDASDVFVTAVHDWPLAGVVRSVVPVSVWKMLAGVPHKRFQEIYTSDPAIAKVRGGSDRQE